MSVCSNPLLALNRGVFNGKMSLKFLPWRADMGYDQYCERYGKQNLLMIPCGKCPACLSRRAKEWAVRCTLEALDHEHNCFITLTYDQKHYDGKSHKDHLLKFIKALRNDGAKIRYFGVSEAGDEFGRYHYHLLLFGFFPGDAKPWAKSQAGFMQFTSKYLDSKWIDSDGSNRGLLVVSEFSPYAAQYTAGYCVKKLAVGDDSSFHIQSTRPGIGAGYFMRNVQDIYDGDKLILSFGSHLFSVPRYFDKLAANMAVDLTDIKLARLDKADKLAHQQMLDHGFESRDRLLVHNEMVFKNKLRFKKRKF